jgi:CHASE3 domain sensor protein
MEATKDEIYSAIGRPANPKLRMIFVFIIVFILVILLIVFLLITDYIQISDPIRG